MKIKRRPATGRKQAENENNGTKRIINIPPKPVNSECILELGLQMRLKLRRIARAEVLRLEEPNPRL
jgi:hypothetical protein